MRLAFVLAPSQNVFFAELVEAMRGELDALGVDSEISWDGFPPPQRDLVYVLVPPHEWFALEGGESPPTDGQLDRTVFLCAEQPGTGHFEENSRLAPKAGAVFDINPSSVR